MLELNTSIAQNLIVTVVGGTVLSNLSALHDYNFLGPGDQPIFISQPVVFSGININSAITFITEGSLSQQIPAFTINDDKTALEAVEKYPLSIVASSIITYNVKLGPDTYIEIHDDDSNEIVFWLIAFIPEI